MMRLATQTAQEGFTLSKLPIRLEIASANKRKPNHLFAGGPTGCHSSAVENSSTTPKTELSSTGKSQQTVASPRVIR